jgi:hypothetical protein
MIIEARGDLYVDKIKTQNLSTGSQRPVEFGQHVRGRLNFAGDLRAE